MSSPSDPIPAFQRLPPCCLFPFLKAAVRPVLTVLPVAEGLWSQSHLKP